MIKGIQYQSGMKSGQLWGTGFNCVEYRYTDCQEGKGQAEDGEHRMTGLTVTQDQLWQGGLLQVLQSTAARDVSYLAIETVGIRDIEKLRELLEENQEEIRHSGMQINIENGYHRRDGEQLVRDDFSKASVLKDLTDRLNHRMGNTCYGICLNTGYANLLGQNLCAMIEELGPRLALIHVNDNDGLHDLCQLPYTFTKGRGQLITDWYSMIGTLTRIRFDGPVVFNVTGLFDASPLPLYPVWYKLLIAVAQEWEMVLELEEYLKKTNCRILFGAGRMLENYMEVWGTSYPPAFVVDNNKNLWGGRRLGIEVRPPKAILQYAESERTVLLCNRYYEPIEEQLRVMGIQSRRYNDQYFFGQQGAGI